jgi:CRP-like cAMP-binding protein
MRGRFEESMAQDKRGGYVSCDACPWRQGDIFKLVSPSDIAAINGFKRDHINVPAGRTLIRRDTKQSTFYTLFQGWAYRYATVNGGRQIFHFCLPGDLVGVQAPLTGRVPYTVQTLTDASLCVFECDGLELLFERHPNLAFEVARMAASEAALMEIHLSTIGRRSAESRVAYLLAELYTRLRQRKLTIDNTCMLPLTQEHLADALGLSTVHVSRMLRVLNDDGLARLDRGHLTILDLTGLSHRAEIDGELDFPQPSLL